MPVRVRLTIILSADEELCEPGTFAFVMLHLLSKGGRHLSAVNKLLHLIERLEELHTEVHWIISSPHLARTLLYDVLCQWSQNLNRCMAMLASKVVEAPGASAPSTLNQSLLSWM